MLSIVIHTRILSANYLSNAFEKWYFYASVNLKLSQRAIYIQRDTCPHLAAFHSSIIRPSNH